ncbi:hypothetical protein ACF09J_07845 [Streptomyces sp. NPDC014889]|uniref:hypothetical protein n=1 Tax=Streptomyces sp. NPDC014889 TaxID=3364928 RepID=UPI0036FD6F14
MIIHDAADAFVTLIYAALIWAWVLGAAAGLALSTLFFAARPLVATTTRAIRRGIRPIWAGGRARLARARSKRDYGEAA